MGDSDSYGHPERNCSEAAGLFVLLMMLLYGIISPRKPRA